MKLESSLQKHPPFLHLAPLLDTVVMLLVVFLIGPSFIRPGGVPIDLPVSQMSINPVGDSHLLVVHSSEEPLYFHFDHIPTTFPELKKMLEAEKKAGNEWHIVMMADGQVQFRTIRSLTKVIVENGHRLTMATDLESMIDE